MMTQQELTELRDMVEKVLGFPRVTTPDSVSRVMAAMITADAVKMHSNHVSMQLAHMVSKMGNGERND